MLTPEKIARIHALYLRGSPHESEAAETILRNAGIDPKTYSDPTEDPIVIAEIPFKTVQEKNIVFQVLAKVLDDYTISHLKSDKKIRAKVPKSKLRQAVEHSKTVLGLWRQELKRFEHAFVIKNRLFPETNKEGVQETALSSDEIAEILDMARNIKQVHLGNLFEKW